MPHSALREFRTTALLVIVSLAAVSLQAGERWKVQFFYDKSDSSFNILDLQCPSPERCIAAGVIEDKNGREKGSVVLTRDGGLHWNLVDIKENPLSLFFLNDSQGWMVTNHGIWATDEGGTSWTKLESLRGIVRVYFLDASHGYAIGFPKAVYETMDGGKKWTKLAAASSPTTNPKHTVYDCIAFNGQHGVILGAIEHNEPDQFSAFPINASKSRPEQNSPVAILETSDGGKTWQQKTDTFFGEITKLALAKEEIVLLVQYFHSYSLPSSVVRWEHASAKLETIFGERNRAGTDFALFPDGGAVLAAIEPPGNSNQIPVPGKLKMLESSDLKTWREMDVDYRAVAQRAILAAPDSEHQWVATDTGMILGLSEKSGAGR